MSIGRTTNLLISAAASIAVLTIAGTYVLYQIMESFSGRSSLCIAGAASSIVISCYYGFKEGRSFQSTTIILSLLFSLPLIPVFYILKNDHADMVAALAPFSIGFSLLFGFNLGNWIRDSSGK